jgi:hypothetical protein
MLWWLVSSTLCVSLHNARVLRKSSHCKEVLHGQRHGQRQYWLEAETIAMMHLSQNW